MKIRLLIENDIESLAVLYKQFWGEESSQEKMKKTFIRLAANPSYIFLGAEQDNQLVGSVMGIVCEELYGNCDPFMVVEDVIVDADWRRTGIGSKLMNEIEKQAIDRGCHYIIFVTESDRTEAVQFYESLGYKSDVYRGFKRELKQGLEELDRGEKSEYKFG